MKFITPQFITPVLLVIILAVSVTAATELTDPLTIGNLGFYAYEQGELVLAEKLFLKALAEDPSYEHARFNLATLYNEQGRYGDAAAQLEILVGADANNVQYQYDLGVNYIANFRYGSQELVDFHQGIAAYEAAAVLDENYAHVQENLRVLYMIKEEFGL